MPSWDPKQYLRFAGPRERPALDLLARVPLAETGTGAPHRIADLGCGAGAMARRLVERWPAAQVIGVDGSAAMLERARAEPGRVEWRHADLAAWQPEAPLDLIFSNAALHWLDDHASVFPRLMGLLAPGGVLAVQMPRNFGEPSHTAMLESAEAGPWRERVRAALRPSPVAPPAIYYDLLAPLARDLDIWESVYLHVLEGEDPVVEWTKGTGLRPCLDALVAGEEAAFLADYAARVRSAYPRRADGRTLYPFRRLFLVAVR